MVVCEECKKVIGEVMDRAHPGASIKEEFPVVCSSCHKNTTVPFKPNPGWATYCRDCYRTRRR